MECRKCKKEEGVKEYPAFRWSGSGGHKLKGRTMTLHPRCYKEYVKDLIVGLAELDEVMDYCDYFEREKGREGFYVREGKRFPVNGAWDGFHIFETTLFPNLDFPKEELRGFREFLKENGWEKDWFKLRSSYVKS